MERLIKVNYETFRKGWQAAVMVIGTSRFFLLADFILLYEAIIAPFWNGKKFSRPAPEIIAIALILAIASIYSPRPVDGFQTAFRVILLATVLPAYKYGFHYKKMAGVILFGLALLVTVQSTTDLRPDGLHMNALLLAESALVFMPIFWYEIGLACALIIVMSLSRTPLVAFVIFAVLSRRRYAVALAAVTSAMFLVYASVSVPERVSVAGIEHAIFDRVETVTGFDREHLESVYTDGKCGEIRPVEYRQFGYGLYGYCASTGQPRPHNIYALSFYEFGVLFLPFWALIFYAARRLSYVQILPLLALGMVSDNLLGRPEGIYLIAAWLISTNLMFNRTPNANPTQSARNLEGNNVEG